MNEQQKAQIMAHAKADLKPKARLAQTLRRIAHRLSPEYMMAAEITYAKDTPIGVDISFRGDKRVKGFLYASPNLEAEHLSCLTPTPVKRPNPFEVPADPVWD